MSNLYLPKSTIENIKMVIFDKDGTLIDIHHYWCSMIEFRAFFFIDEIEIEPLLQKRLYSELVNAMGIDLNRKKMKPEGPVGIKPREYIMRVALKTIQKYAKNYTMESVDRVFKKVDNYSKSKLNSIVKPLIGVKEILNRLKDENIKIAIATTDLTDRAKLAMSVLNLDKYFNTIAGADLVKSPKPKSDLVEYILKKNNLKNSDIVVIGDSMADLEMAKNANCKFIGVKTGLYRESFIEQSEYLIDNLEELKVDK